MELDALSRECMDIHLANARRRLKLAVDNAGDAPSTCEAQRLR
jgi:hypothetical protein